jgi:hypothetical protein
MRFRMDWVAFRAGSLGMEGAMSCLASRERLA